MPRPDIYRCNALTNLGKHAGGPVAAGSFTSRTRHVVRRTGYGLVLTWGMAYPVGSTTQETTYTGTTTLKAAVELPDGSIIPAFFNGSRTGSSAAGGGPISTDPIGVSLTEGDVIWLRCYFQNATSLHITRNNDYQRGEGYVSGSDLVDSGTVTASGGFVCTPTLATLQVPTLENGVVILGDSISAGTGDAGWFGGFACTALEPFHACAQLGSPSEAVSNFVTGNQSARRLQLAGMSGAEHCLLHWSNDPWNGRTLAQFQADIRTAVKMVARMGMRVWVCTLPPRTTTTDGWKSLANQTLTSVPQDTVRRNINAWLRQEFTDPDVSGILDTATSVESQTDPGKWLAPPGGVALTGTITSTVAGTATDNTKSWTAGQWDGYLVRNFSTAGGPSLIVRTQATNVLSNGVVPFTVGNTYEIYPGATTDGIHPSGYFHNLMASAVAAQNLL